MQSQIHSIGVYDLNGKGCLTGCGPHGDSHVSLLLVTGQSNTFVHLYIFASYLIII